MPWFFYIVAILLTIVCSLITCKLYIELTTGWCRSKASLRGKTAIVTGANTGIGYETAKDFAKRGARVILACRNEGRGKEAEEKIIKETGNKNVAFKKLDMDSFESVRAFARDINSSEKRLDILVNNAGICGNGKTKTADGLLLIMQTNYFSAFLLTILLLDMMKKTKKSRIVNVGSTAAKSARNFDVNNPNSDSQEHNFSSEVHLYCRSKLCNILFTIELAKRLRGTGVTSYSVHPGVVLTELSKDLFRTISLIVVPILKWIVKDSLAGAQTSIYCSVAEDIEDLSGEHFEDCNRVERYKTARDPELPGKLWAATEQLIGDVQKKHP